MRVTLRSCRSWRPATTSLCALAFVTLLRGLSAQTPSPVALARPLASAATAGSSPLNISATMPDGVVLRDLGDSITVPAAHGVPLRRAGQMPRIDTVAPWWAPAASLLLPGSGQFVLRQQRTVAYLAAETFVLIQYLGARRDGGKQRDRYRALARDVARAPFGGARPVGSWDYYESMEKYDESGVFDRVPGGELDPETDETTFNGARWLLARETYWRDPDQAPARGSAEYQRALAAYMERAVRDEFRWSWRDAQLERDLYQQAVAGANRSYQRATTLVGIVAVNHLLSMVDAYVNVRLRRYGGVAVSTSALLPRDGMGPFSGSPAASDAWRDRFAVQLHAPFR